MDSIWGKENWCPQTDGKTCQAETLDHQDQAHIEYSKKGDGPDFKFFSEKVTKGQSTRYIEKSKDDNDLEHYNESIDTGGQHKSMEIVYDRKKSAAKLTVVGFGEDEAYNIARDFPQVPRSPHTVAEDEGIIYTSCHEQKRPTTSTSTR